MKDKKVFTYLLLAGSLVVWGLVIYKVVSVMGGTEQVPLGNNKLPSAHHVIENEESYEIIGNYRDPFLGTIRGSIFSENGNSITGAGKKTKKVKVVEPEKPLDLSFISYSGMITNPATKKKVALVTINGNQSMVAEGQTIDDVQVLKNFKDSIQILYQGRTACINKRH